MPNNQHLNQQLINKIAELIPKRQNQLNMLMETIHIGKEAAYRRLRGDVAFSFSEACLISNKLGISLDVIFESNTKNGLSFKLENKASDNIEGLYAKRIDSYFYSFMPQAQDPELEVYCALNTISDSFLFTYKNLSKLRFFKWLYQIRYNTTSINFSELTIPDEIVRKQHIIIRRVSLLKKNVFIFDRNIFASFIKDITYFRSLGLISKEDLKAIKEEINTLFIEVENMLISGKGRGGTRIEAYLSNIDFESNYTYVKGKNFEQAYLDCVYLMNTAITNDPQICRMHALWIESLRKYSTLITISGEMERRKFFMKQKELLEKL